ncbi:hypothetical protein EVAR_71872_1 [Eumeta japonica]|uniref:Uncharacterized protein n=1 Tax=Eumeta variegata TaxID=151549 RepID=A0A4C1SKC2_EUMVA|nr:hypothetical protein EVAR_71872_1 [Eumeta japonica]
MEPTRLSGITGSWKLVQGFYGGYRRENRTFTGHNPITGHMLEEIGEQRNNLFILVVELSPNNELKPSIFCETVQLSLEIGDDKMLKT